MKAVSGILAVLLTICLLVSVFSIQLTKASGIAVPKFGTSDYLGYRQSGELSSTGDWNVTYGNGDLYSVVQTIDGGYALAGSRGGFWLVKTDAYGQMQWSKTYGRGTAWANSLIQTNDGGYLMVGSAYSFEDSRIDGWSVKTDASGNMLWNHTYGGAGMDWICRVIQGHGSVAYAMVGKTTSYSDPDGDLWLTMTDEQGNLLLTKTYGGPGEQSGHDIVDLRLKPEGGYIMAGYSAVASSVWLIRIDDAGNELWNRTLGLGVGNSIVSTSDGGFAITGCMNGPLLIKTDEDGNVQWNKKYLNDGTGGSVIQTGDGGYAIAGQTEVDIPSGGKLAAFLIKTDIDGNLEWEKDFRGGYCAAACQLIQTDVGHFVLVGWRLMPDQHYVGWLIKSSPKYSLKLVSMPTGVMFTVDSIRPTTPWSAAYDNNTSVSFEMPETYSSGEARYYWNQWSDGLTDRSRTILMTTNVRLTAQYTGPFYELAISSSTSGIAFVVNAVPKTTPYVERLMGGSYVLEMPESFDGFVWSHWSEDGDTNRTKTVVLDRGVNLTVVFNLLGDLTEDGKVDIEDLAAAAKSFGSYPGTLGWNPLADINEDNKIDVRDLVLIAKNYGKTYQ